jgi:glycerol-3-phosphate cytidylyltransferase
MIVYVGGTFDLFHVGHVNLLRRASELGEVTVSLNRDEFVSRFKGRPPVIRFADREAVLRSCRYVTDVVENTGEDDSKPVILSVRPNIIVAGGDWAPPRDYLGVLGVPEGWLESLGIELRFVPRTPGISSSGIRTLLDASVYLHV